MEKYWDNCITLIENMHTPAEYPLQNQAPDVTG
jgi:hypothetical protein